MMLDTGSLNAGAEIIAQLILVMTGEFTSEEGGCQVSLHGWLFW
jgi:hypothetical protein